MSNHQLHRIGSLARSGLLWLSLLVFVRPVAADGGDLGALMLQLGAEDRDQAAAAIEALAQRPEPAALAALEALRDHTLRIAPGGKPLIKREDGKLVDAVSGGAVSADASSLSAPTLNNALRRELGPAIAALELRSPDAKLRLTAAEALGKALDEKLAPAMRAALAKERDPEVKRLLRQSLAQIDFSSSDPKLRILAITAMGESGDVAFKGQLSALLERDSTGKFREPNEAVRAAADDAVSVISRKELFTRVVRDLFYGVSLGSVLLLAALGLAVTFGLMRVINMAHGEMLMLGAYSTYCAQLLFQKFAPGALDYYIVLALPLSFGVCMLVGMVLERSVIRFLYGRPLETLLATWGISLMLIQTVRVVFGAQNVTVANPSWLSGGYELLQGVVLPYNRIATVSFVVLVVLFVNWLLRSTSLGLQVRAITQNRAMAACMGINTARIDMLTFGLGSGIAGLGGRGAVAARQRRAGARPAVHRGFVLGRGRGRGRQDRRQRRGGARPRDDQQVARAVRGRRAWARSSCLVFVVLFIQRRPQGLFALKGRSAEG